MGCISSSIMYSRSTTGIPHLKIEVHCLKCTWFQKCGQRKLYKASVQSDIHDSGIQITNDSNNSAIKNKLKSKGNRK